jgi:hypothetical protein
MNLIIGPKLIKSNNIKTHQNYFNNLKGKKLVTDLNIDLYYLKNFDYKSDKVTNELAYSYKYKNSIKVFSKNTSFLYIDGDQCINCLVNIDNKSCKGLIVLDSEFNKLKHCRLYTGDIQDTLNYFEIKNVFETEILPGEILIFNSNNYHLFDGTKFLIHKFINHLDLTLYNPIYTCR